MRLVKVVKTYQYFQGPKKYHNNKSQLNKYIYQTTEAFTFSLAEMLRKLC